MNTIPTPVQILLLKAALQKGAGGRNALTAWQASTRFETLDPDSGWVLPLLYCTLRAQGVSVPDFAKYEFVYRHNWYKNHLFLHRILQVLDAFERLGISMVWLKGAASAIHYYDDLGARPINHFDAWTSPVHKTQILNQLPSLGWTQVQDNTLTTTFQDAYRRTIHLHWQLFGDSVDQSICAGVIQHRLERKNNATSINLLAPTDQFLHLCANADAWDSRSSLLAIVDAAQLMSSNAVLSPRVIAARIAQLEIKVNTSQVWALLDTLLPQDTKVGC